jgi:hypothetical protein
MFSLKVEDLFEHPCRSRVATQAMRIAGFITVVFNKAGTCSVSSTNIANIFWKGVIEIMSNNFGKHAIIIVRCKDLSTSG